MKEMKSTLHSLILFLIFHLLLLLLLAPAVPSSQQPNRQPQGGRYNDIYLRRYKLTQEAGNTVQNRLDELSRQMSARALEYGRTVLFRHFHAQLVACTDRTTNLLAVACYADLFIFLQDLGLLPQRYIGTLRRQPRPLLEADWRAYLREQPHQPQVADHPIAVPQPLVDLLADPVNLPGLIRLPSGAGTVSYSDLMGEFLRCQAAYASFFWHDRKRSTFYQSSQAINRRLKLQAIYLLAVARDFLGEAFIEPPQNQAEAGEVPVPEGEAAEEEDPDQEFNYFFPNWQQDRLRVPELQVQIEGDGNMELVEPELTTQYFLNMDSGNPWLHDPDFFPQGEKRPLEEEEEEEVDEEEARRLMDSIFSDAKYDLFIPGRGNPRMRSLDEEKEAVAGKDAQLVKRQKVIFSRFELSPLLVTLMAVGFIVFIWAIYKWNSPVQEEVITTTPGTSIHNV